jgi:hypothetical protein
MSKALKRMSSTERFQHELGKIDRRIMKPGTTPEQKQELLIQRKRLFAPPAKGKLSQAEIDAVMRSREEILALLDAPVRASLEAEAKGDHDELLDLIGTTVYCINVVDGTNEQIAELINRGYRGADDVLRSVDTALAIARGETAEAKAAREAGEVEDRREFVERCLGLLREHVRPDLVVVGLLSSEGTAEP